MSSLLISGRQQIAPNAFKKLFFNCLAAIGDDSCCILEGNKPIALQAVSDWMLGHQDNNDCLQRTVNGIISDPVPRCSRSHDASYRMVYRNSLRLRVH